MTPQLWTKISSRELLPTKIFTVHGDTYIHPVRKTSMEYITIDTSDWVNVVAITPDEKILLVRQFRSAVNELSWEIPGGIIERGEDPVVAGLRELREETGYSTTQATLLASNRPNPAILNNHTHVVLAENVTPDPAGINWDTNEEIETKLLPISELPDWILSQRINHSIVLAALHLYQLHRQKKP